MCCFIDELIKPCGAKVSQTQRVVQGWKLHSTTLGRSVLGFVPLRFHPSFLFSFPPPCALYLILLFTPLPSYRFVFPNTSCLVPPVFFSTPLSLTSLSVCISPSLHLHASPPWFRTRTPLSSSSSSVIASLCWLVVSLSVPEELMYSPSLRTAGWNW